MQSETFKKTIAAIAGYHADLKPFDTRRRISAPAKEAVAKTCESLDAIMVLANETIAEIVKPEDGEDMTEYDAAVAAIWATKYNVQAWRITKAQAPLSWTPADMRKLSFMFTDWSA